MLIWYLAWPGFLVFSITLFKSCNMKMRYLFGGGTVCIILHAYNIKTETLYKNVRIIEDFKTRFHTYTFNYQYQIKSNLVTIRRLNRKLNLIFLIVDSLPFKNNVKWNLICDYCIVVSNRLHCNKRQHIYNNSIMVNRANSCSE